MRFSMSLDKSTPPKLIVSFPAPVNPSIANEPGRTRFTFRREPVVSSGQDSVNFSDSSISSAVFAEHDGLAELDVMATEPLMANFADGGKTIIVSPVPPPPPPAPAAPAPQAQTQAQTPATPAKPTGPRFLVIIDPGHGGAETGAMITPTLLEKDVVLTLARKLQHELQARGIVAWLLRSSDVAVSLDQRAAATNGSRAALYITLHAANTGRGVHVFTSLLPPTNVERTSFLPWDTAQAAFLDLSGTVAGSVAAELENRKLPNATLVAPLRPMNNIAAPAFAVEIAPPGDQVEDIASAQYLDQVAQSIAAGVAAVRSKLPEVRP
jgi:N-acetylmuramoyl-L-alanine amidase